MTKTLHLNQVRVSPMQQIGLHVQPTWELSLILCGEGVRIIGDMCEPFREGDLVLVPPEVPHCWQFSHGEKFVENITVVFSSDLFRNASAVFPELEEVFSSLAVQKVAIAFSGNLQKKLTEILLRMPAMSEALQVVSLLQMLVEITECNEKRIVGKKNVETESAFRLRQIKTFIACNYKRGITIEDIARFVGMNRSALCTFFKRQTGKTIVFHLNRVRFDVACHLLRTTSLTIQQVCYESGFQDVPHFCRMFKRTFGQTPTAYRKNNKHV